jgi:hypothetical protein
MKKISPLSALAAFTLIASVQAHAKKDCTTEPKSKWLSQQEFQKRAEAQGYTIRKFKVSGNCYEIYGSDKAGKDVEIYFNPVDGSIAKQAH